jgi:glucose-1-phosphate thymidylyltransferase
MTIVIPLAGYGTRLRPMTFSVPKPLLLCAGSTVLDLILRSIKGLSPEEIILIIGYKGNMIRDWVRANHKDLPVNFVTQEEPKGLGHAVWKVGNKVEPDGDVLIYLGDSIFDVEWEKIKMGKENFIGIKEVEKPEKFGIVKMQGDKVIDLFEKPDNPVSNLAVVGLYYLKKWSSLYKHLDFLIEEGMKTKEEYQLTDGLKLMLERADIELKEFSVKEWYDCGKIDTLLKTNTELLKNPPDWMDFENDKKKYSYIDSSSVLKDSNLGDFVTVGENSLIEESSIENSIIGNGVKIINSNIFDSIIGDNTEVVNCNGKFVVGSNSIINGKGAYK